MLRIDMDSPLGSFILVESANSSRGRGAHVPSTDLPESSDLGLSFSEPLAEQAKGALDALWRFAWALPGAPHVSSGALYYIAGPTTASFSLEQGIRGFQWTATIDRGQFMGFAVKWVPCRGCIVI